MIPRAYVEALLDRVAQPELEDASFTCSGSAGSVSTALRTSSSVASPIRTSPGSAALLEARGDVDGVAGRQAAHRCR